jgi:hypothetical protein
MQFLYEDSIKIRLQAAAIYNFKTFSGGYAPPLGPLWGTVSPVDNFIKKEGEGEEIIGYFKRVSLHKCVSLKFTCATLKCNVCIIKSYYNWAG